MTTWSKTKPSEPGWYWVLHGVDCKPRYFVPGDHVGSERFGPRIPSSEDIEAAKDALRDMDCTCLTGLATAEACLVEQHVRTCNYRVARAALAKLEGR